MRWLQASFYYVCYIFQVHSSASNSRIHRKKILKKNVGIAKFFSMYAKGNELVLNETKEETILKIAKTKSLKKTQNNTMKMRSFSP